MTIRESTYYTVVCDLCGGANDGGDYSAWSTELGADEDAEGWDWHVEGGNHICPECRPMPDFEDAEADEADDHLDPGHGSEGHNC